LGSRLAEQPASLTPSGAGDLLAPLLHRLSRGLGLGSDSFVLAGLLLGSLDAALGLGPRLYLALVFALGALDTLG